MLLDLVYTLIFGLSPYSCLLTGLVKIDSVDLFYGLYDYIPQKMALVGLKGMLG